MSLQKPLTTLLGSLLLISSLSVATLSASQTKQMQTKPFLIQGKLPHFTMILKKMWNNEKLALTQAQKKKLLLVRKETLHEVKALKPKITQLENKIVQAAMNGAKPASLQKDVNELAHLRAEATMTHLRCIFNTKKILTKKQLDILE